MFLHYLGKVNSSNLLQITTEKNQKACRIWQKWNIYVFIRLTGDRRYCFLQHMLQVSAVRLHACTKTLAPLVNCIVNDALVNVMPHLLQTLFQFISVVHPRLVLSWTTLQILQSTGLWSGLFAGQRSGGTPALLEKSHSVPCRCAGALSCWKTKNSRYLEHHG